MTVAQQIGVCILGWVLSFLGSVIWGANKKIVSDGIELDKLYLVVGVGVLLYIIWLAIFLIMPK